MDSQFDLYRNMILFFPDSRCFTHRQILRPYSKSTKKLAVLFTPIETKSVSDAECLQLLKQGPVILMERFRDVACSTTEESMPMAMGIPLFCKNSNGEYGLACIYFGVALDRGQKVELHHLQSKASGEVNSSY